MASKGTYLAIAGLGGIFAWSGIKGKSWSEVFRNLIAGKNPSKAANTQQIQPLTAQDTSTSNGATIGVGYGSGSVSVSPPSNQSKDQWARSILKGLGAPQNTATVSSMSSWISHEFPSWPNPPIAKNNPLATTLYMPGSTNFNSDGVKNYPTSFIGVTAIVLTLRMGYPDIVRRLKSGQGLCGWSSQEFLKWSGNGYDSVC